MGGRFATHHRFGKAMSSWLDGNGAQDSVCQIVGDGNKKGPLHGVPAMERANTAAAMHPCTATHRKFKAARSSGAKPRPARVLASAWGVVPRVT